MIYILDTNIISELIKPNPDINVLSWIKKISEDKLYICVLTLGELQAGIENLPISKKRNDLIAWFVDIQDSFQDQILPINTTTAIKWGDLKSKLKKTGWNLPVIDGLLAACALDNSAILVTRNIKDFEHTGVELLNPWL